MVKVKSYVLLVFSRSYLKFVKKLLAKKGCSLVGDINLESSPLTASCVDSRGMNLTDRKSVV